MNQIKSNGRTFLHIACCHFYLQQYAEAEEAAQKGTVCALQNRILFHCAHRLNNENNLMMRHQKLTDSKEDQLSLAAIHYARSHFQEVCVCHNHTYSYTPSLMVCELGSSQATDIYKRLLLENRDDVALNVYVAMCYYKVHQQHQQQQRRASPSLCLVDTHAHNTTTTTAGLL